MPELICPACNKEFHISPSRVKEENFCSGDCRSVYKRTRSGRPIEFYVDENGCFICTSHKAGKRGYPRKHKMLIFRHVYEQMFEFLNEGELVRHLCDNKLCINPAHLRKGTQKENVRDAIKNGKFKLGSQRSQAKLDEVKVAAIKTLLEHGDFSLGELGHCFDVSGTAIEQIKRNKTWMHVKPWKKMM